MANDTRFEVIVAEGASTDATPARPPAAPTPSSTTSHSLFNSAARVSPMTQAAFDRGNWQAVIDAHRLESHDAAEWLRYCSALLHTLEPGPEAGKQQQQAALAFGQAQRIGASAGAMAAAQRQAVIVSLRQALELVGVPASAEPDPPAPLRRVLLVLGMHRSGTSALAGLLCQQGFQAPQNHDGGDAHNPTGYWEPQQIRAFHNSLLEGAQSSWEDPLLPVLPWQPQNLITALADLEQAIAADFPAPDPQAVALIKDPRQCRLLPLWTALFEQRPFQVAIVLAVRQPEAVAASLVSRDQLPLDRALLLWLSHTLEAERATRQLPRLVLSYEQLLQDPAAAVQRCQQLAGLPITTPSAELLGEWIRPNLNHHQRSSDGLERKGEGKTLLQWANTVYAALVEPAAEQQRELLDRAQAVVQEKLQALLEQGSRRVSLQLFWEPEAGGGFSEAASQRRSVMAERGRATVVFQLPAGAERPRLLRLDLAEEPAMVTVLAIRLRSATGSLIWQWPAEQTSPGQEQALPLSSLNPDTLLLEGGVLLAATSDPNVILVAPVEVLQKLGANAELELEAFWQPLPHEVVQMALRERNVQ